MTKRARLWVAIAQLAIGVPIGIGVVECAVHFRML